MSPDAGDDGPLLDCGRLLETVGVDAAEELLAQVHVVEVLADLIPVGVDETLRVHACGAVVAAAAAFLGAAGGGAVGRPFVLGGGRGGRRSEETREFSLSFPSVIKPSCIKPGIPKKVKATQQR